MVSALLLARAGHQVTVLEKNQDFAREFRGEALQPRFLHSMVNEGLLSLVQSLPHESFSDLRMFYRGKELTRIGLSRLDAEFPYVTWIPQPTLLNGLYEEAKKHSNFDLRFGARVSSLLREGEKITGVKFAIGGGEESLESDVVIGADGRFSKLRHLLNSQLAYSSYDFDVMWFEMERPPSYAHGADFFLSPDMNCLILPKHPNKIQVGILVKPAEVKEQRKKGAAWIASRLKRVHPMFESFADELIDFKAFTVLEAKIEMVKQWAYPGLVLVGDAAHTCSPAGAIGVTIAVETAIAAVHVINKCAETGDFSKEALGEVQRLREHEVRRVHKIQRRAVGAIVGNPLTRRL
ncbi:MAG: FAD-dependent monooxygenase, partial [Bdellovibrionales bacterium]|nr:FAD-dependent monooxygenase [Bdellovibrionales bacterium]